MKSSKTVHESKIDETDEVTGKKETMEFTKNYSDDLLMSSSGEQKEQHNQGGGHDLADFELPPYSGSSGSSGSEQAPASTSARNNNNNNTDNVASSSSSATDLTAIKNILISSYSKFSHVFHWKKPIESGVFLGIGLTLITALTFFSIISVVAYSALGIILASGLLRIYKASMKTLNKSTETPVDHIWDKALNMNVKLSPESMHKLVDTSHGNLNSSLAYFKQVLLVEDKLATFKFAFFLYMLTYIGALFNGLTLITITYLSLFTVPLFYERNKTKIDEHIGVVTNQISSTLSMATNKASALVFGSSQSAGAAKKQN